MVVDDLRQQLVQRDALGARGQPGRIAGQHQQQLDQLLHALRGTQHALHLLARAFGQPRLLQRQLGRTGDHRDRRAQFVAGGTDEHPLALDKLLVAVQVIVERVGNRVQFRTAARIDVDALALLARPQRTDVLGQQAQRAYHAFHAERGHQHGDEHHDDAGQHHPARGELFEVVEVGDVQGQRDPPHRAGVAHHHRRLALTHHHPVMQARVQVAQGFRHVRFVEAVQAEGVRILPVVLRFALGVLDDAVQLGIEQRAPGGMLGMLVHVVAHAEHRQRNQRQVAQQPADHTPVQRARLRRFLHRFHCLHCHWPPTGSRRAAGYGSACR